MISIHAENRLCKISSIIIVILPSSFFILGPGPSVEELIKLNFMSTDLARQNNHACSALHE